MSAPAPRPSGEPAPGEQDMRMALDMSERGLRHAIRDLSKIADVLEGALPRSAPAPTATPDPDGVALAKLVHRFVAAWNDLAIPGDRGDALLVEMNLLASAILAPPGTATEGGRDALAKEMCSLCSYAYVRDFDNLPDDDREEWLRLADYVLARESGLQAHVSALREQRDAAIDDRNDAIKLAEQAQVREREAVHKMLVERELAEKAEAQRDEARREAASHLEAFGNKGRSHDKLALALAAAREEAAHEKDENSDLNRQLVNEQVANQALLAQRNDAREEAARLREAQKLHERVDRCHTEHYSALSTAWRLQTEQLKELRRLAQRLCDEAGKATASDDPLRVVEAVAWMDLRAFLVPHTVTVVDTP